jgi:hypothetical protein
MPATVSYRMVWSFPFAPGYAATYAAETVDCLGRAPWAHAVGPGARPGESEERVTALLAGSLEPR